MKTNIIKSLIVICMVVAAPVMASAQLSGLPADGGMDVAQQSPGGTEIPFDFGIGLMAAAGIGYSVKKRRDQKRAKAGDGAINVLG